MTLRFPFLNPRAESRWAFNRQLEEEMLGKYLVHDMKPYILSDLCFDTEVGRGGLPEPRDPIQLKENCFKFWLELEQSFGLEIPCTKKKLKDVQRWAKKWSLGCVNCLPCSAWLLLSKTGSLFSPSLYSLDMS